MIEYNIYFALGGKHTDNAEQVHLGKVLEKVCENFGGYSLQKIQGGWKHQEVMIEEDSYRLTLMTDTEKNDKLSSLSFYIQRNFNQEEVLITQNEVKVLNL